jgi:hypothetical protein
VRARKIWRKGGIACRLKRGGARERKRKRRREGAAGGMDGDITAAWRRRWAAAISKAYLYNLSALNMKMLNKQLNSVSARGIYRTPPRRRLSSSAGWRRGAASVGAKPPT